MAKFETVAIGELKHRLPAKLRPLVEEYKSKLGKLDVDQGGSSSSRKGTTCPSPKPRPAANRPSPAEPRRSGGLGPSPPGPFPFRQLGVRGSGQFSQLVKDHRRAGSSPGRGSMDPCHGNRACATRSSWASGGGKWAGRPYRN